MNDDIKKRKQKVIEDTIKSVRATARKNLGIKNEKELRAEAVQKAEARRLAEKERILEKKRIC